MIHAPTTDPWALPPTKWDRDVYSRLSLDHHPGKMPCTLAERLLEMYGKRGMLVYDPMCGIGTTIVEALRRGMIGIGLEIEPCIVTMAAENLTRAKEVFQTDRGNIIQGDALQFVQSAPRANLILTSPPHLGSLSGSGVGSSHGLSIAVRARMNELGRPLRRDEYCEIENAWQRDGRSNQYSISPCNIGNIRAKGDYKDAMKKVYRNMVLSHTAGGRIIVVLRNVLSNWKVVHLDEMAIEIIEGYGVPLTAWHQSKIMSMTPGRVASMAKWRRRMKADFPIMTDEILVFGGGRPREKTG